MSTASERLEKKLEEKLKNRLNERDEAYGNFFLIIAPIIIEVLQKLMEGCNNTPEKAAKALKRGSPWARANIRRGVRQRAECDECRQECCLAVDDTIHESSEEDLADAFRDQKENEVDWNHSPI